MHARTSLLASVFSATFPASEIKLRCSCLHTGLVICDDIMDSVEMHWTHHGMLLDTRYMLSKDEHYVCYEIYHDEEKTCLGQSPDGEVVCDADCRRRDLRLAISAALCGGLARMDA